MPDDGGNGRFIRFQVGWINYEDHEWESGYQRTIRMRKEN